MSPSLAKLVARIEDSSSADVSLKDVRVLAKLHDPEVIPALAGLLDSSGRVGREAVRALMAFGRVAEPALRRCVESHDETIRAHAEELLAALGETPEVEMRELAAPESGNDNEVADATMLADPEVVRSIKGTLYGDGVPPQDIDDGVTEVQTRVLEMLRAAPGPSGLSEWRSLASKVAEDLAIDLLRKREVQQKYGGDLCDEPDVFTRPHERDYDSIDAKRLLAIFKELRDKGELPPLAAEIAEAKMGGLTDAEIGEEFGLPEAVVRKRRERTKARFVQAILARGMAELIPQGARTKKSGEAAAMDDLPTPLPTRRG